MEMIITNDLIGPIGTHERFMRISTATSTIWKEELELKPSIIMLWGKKLKF